MCGIIGFTGDGDVMGRLIAGLDALEYRGYDSAGVAFFDGGALKCVKSCGRLPKLVAQLERTDMSDVSCGIGHTRWATHGAVTEKNAHPHGNGRLYGVHNGLIENCDELERYLRGHGYTFESETDTERVLLLVDLLYRKYRDPLGALRGAFAKLRGSAALGIVFADRPGEIYAARRDSPLLVCRSKDGYYISSDTSAVGADATEYAILEDGETACLRRTSVSFFTEDGEEKEKKFHPITRIEGTDSGAEYTHYMLREICEEPAALERALGILSPGELPSEEATKLSEERLRRLGCIHIVACGTAMHAGLLGKLVIERMARVRVNVEIASEFRCRSPILDKEDIVLVISQSGETADTVAALRYAKRCGIFTLAIVNSPTSTIAREADAVIDMRAGPERSVASTKAYTVQAALLYLIAIRIAAVRGAVELSRAGAMCAELCRLPQSLTRTPSLDSSCRAVAHCCADAEHIFFIGRGQDFAVATEAALKMKEITYKHSEPCAAGELKHGMISLIEPGIPVLCFITDEALFDKSYNNMRELAARGARLVLFAPRRFAARAECCEMTVELDEGAGEFMPLCAALAAQLVAYYTALELGRDIDRPRNLAKSVTVE